MANDLFMVDGKIIEAPDAQASFLCPPFMFGHGVLDRLRFFLTSRGLLCPGFRQHWDRTRAAVRLLFPDVSDDLFENWKQWLVSAVQASKIEQDIYVHLGVGPYGNSGTMLQGAPGALQAFIFVKSEEPLYGDRLCVSSEVGFPRPDGPLADHKVHGLYAELLYLKSRARKRLSDRDPRSVETLLFARQSCTPNCNLEHGDPLVAEYGCANSFALDAQGNLHLPKEGVRYFRGVTVQIVEALYCAYFPGKQVLHDLRRSHLRFNGGAAGTACGVVPVVELDGESCEVTEQFEALAALYRRLCDGSLNNAAFQEEWAPVVLLVSGQRAAVG